MVLGHFDGDENLDVAFTRVNDPNVGGTGEIGLLYGKGDGSFVAGPDVMGGIFGTMGVTADFDRDGSDDLQVILRGTQNSPDPFMSEIRAEHGHEPHGDDLNPSAACDRGLLRGGRSRR